jgi:hypothetical protein
MVKTGEASLEEEEVKDKRGEGTKTRDNKIHQGILSAEKMPCGRRCALL